MRRLWQISAGLPAFIISQDGRVCHAATATMVNNNRNYENESHIALQNNEHKVTTVLSSLQSDAQLDIHFNFLQALKGRHFFSPDLWYDSQMKIKICEMIEMLHGAITA